ncbi:MAG: hypothetical protein JWN15_387 [Firmicutes bacterium]|nr:hypothetical protein [Bacillota bacterium]
MTGNAAKSPAAIRKRSSLRERLQLGNDFGVEHADFQSDRAIGGGFRKADEIIGESLREAHVCQTPSILAEGDDPG